MKTRQDGTVAMTGKESSHVSPPFTQPGCPIRICDNDEGERTSTDSALCTLVIFYSMLSQRLPRKSKRRSHLMGGRGARVVLARLLSSAGHEQDGVVVPPSSSERVLAILSLPEDALFRPFGFSGVANMTTYSRTLSSYSWGQRLMIAAS